MAIRYDIFVNDSVSKLACSQKRSCDGSAIQWTRSPQSGLRRKHRPAWHHIRPPLNGTAC